MVDLRLDIHPLLVITGPPGSGKSTIARCVADQMERSSLVRGDDFFAFLHRGTVSPWLPHAHRQNTAVIAAAGAACAQLLTWSPVVYEGVLGPWFLDHFRAQLAHHAILTYVTLLPPLEECLNRVEARNNHGFTDLDAARQLWQEFNETKRPGLTVSNTQPPEDVAASILHHPHTQL